MNDSTDIVANEALFEEDGPPLPIGLRAMFDDRLYARIELVAERMSKAQGITPAHLLGKKEACFFVCTAALNWRLDPMYVAKNTYQTPGGQVGNFGALVNAIIEQSGRLEPGTGGVRFEHFGDWSAIAGRFEVRESKKTDGEGQPKKYTAQTWTLADAKKSGAGVIIRARLRGEREDREFSLLLEQAFPLNSTLWATDPRTQIIYLATRRFANVCMPAVLGGFADPINDSPAPEREVLGEHEIERPEIRMPEPRVSLPDGRRVPVNVHGEPMIPGSPASPSPATTEKDHSRSDDASNRLPVGDSGIDMSTGEVRPPPGNGGGNGGGLMPGQMNILRADMRHYNVDDGEIVHKFGVPLDQLPFAKFAEVRKFICGGKENG